MVKRTGLWGRQTYTRLEFKITWASYLILWLSLSICQKNIVLYLPAVEDCWGFKCINAGLLSFGTIWPFRPDHCFGVTIFCIVGCLAAPLARAPYIPPLVATKNVSRHCQMSHEGGKNPPSLIYLPSCWSYVKFDVLNATEKLSVTAPLKKNSCE